MWIVRHGNQMFNLEAYINVYVDDDTLYFNGIDDEMSFDIEFATPKEAEQNFKYIIEGFKNKNQVIHL